jgi:hypothetical protein
VPSTSIPASSSICTARGPLYENRGHPGVLSFVPRTAMPRREQALTVHIVRPDLPGLTHQRDHRSGFEGA